MGWLSYHKHEENQNKEITDMNVSIHNVSTSVGHFKVVGASSSVAISSECQTSVRLVHCTAVSAFVFLWITYVIRTLFCLLYHIKSLFHWLCQELHFYSLGPTST